MLDWIQGHPSQHVGPLSPKCSRIACMRASLQRDRKIQRDGINGDFWMMFASTSCPVFECRLWHFQNRRMPSRRCLPAPAQGRRPTSRSPWSAQVRNGRRRESGRAGVPNATGSAIRHRFVLTSRISVLVSIGSLSSQQCNHAMISFPGIRKPPRPGFQDKSAQLSTTGIANCPPWHRCRSRRSGT